GQRVGSCHGRREFRSLQSPTPRNVKGDPSSTSRAPMFERPRGTNDWGPEEMAKRRFVESRFIQLAESFGFREVSTPAFESLDLFTAKSGPGIVKELYASKTKEDGILPCVPSSPPRSCGSTCPAFGAARNRSRCT